MNIYVGSISRTATEQDLRDAFAAFGEVQSAAGTDRMGTCTPGTCPRIGLSCCASRPDHPSPGVDVRGQEAASLDPARTQHEGWLPARAARHGIVERRLTCGDAPRYHPLRR